MKAFAPIVATTALFAATNAATVKIDTTQCVQNVALENFEVTVGTLFVKELKSVCGLKISSVTGAPADSISCQAFKDKEGKNSGSAMFTQAKPAQIATNPVQINSVMCSTGNSTGTGSAPSPTGGAGAPNGGNGTTPAGGSPSQPAINNGAGQMFGMSLGAAVAAIAAGVVGL